MLFRNSEQILFKFAHCFQNYKQCTITYYKYKSAIILCHIGYHRSTALIIYTLKRLKYLIDTKIK